LIPSFKVFLVGPIIENEIACNSMGFLIERVLGLFGEKEYRIVMVGLDGLLPFGIHCLFK
jgi:hypothetical protein